MSGPIAERTGNQTNSGPSHFAGAHHFKVERQYNIGQQYVGSMGLLDRLNPIPDASHNRSRKTSPPDSICLHGTRKGVLDEVASWVDSGFARKNDPGHVLWLYGYVGCGKSAIAQTIAEQFANRGRVVASFFFFRGSGDRSKITRFAATLATQLAAAIPSTASSINAALRKHAGLLTAFPLSRQLHYLFFKPFQTALRNPARVAQALLKGPFLVVIDGLDECEDHAQVIEFIDCIVAFFKQNPRTPLRFFISSRVEEHIRTHLDASQVRLLNLVDHSSLNDILFVVNETFDEAARHDRVLQAFAETWPAPNDRQLLAKHADGSFIFMSSILKFILQPADDGSTPMSRLSLALAIDTGLDGLYTQTLARSKDLPHFSSIISTIALLESPLSISALARLLDIERFEVIRVLVHLHAIIQVPGDDDTPVALFHTSLRDFLTTESRSQCYFASHSYHEFLTFRFLSLYSTSLGGLDSPSDRSAVVQYCQTHWATHYECFLYSVGKRSFNLRQHLHDIIPYFNTAYHPEMCPRVIATWLQLDPLFIPPFQLDRRFIPPLQRDRRFIPPPQLPCPAPQVQPLSDRFVRSIPVPAIGGRDYYDESRLILYMLDSQHDPSPAASQRRAHAALLFQALDQLKTFLSAAPDFDKELQIILLRDMHPDPQFPHTTILSSCIVKLNPSLAAEWDLCFSGAQFHGEGYPFLAFPRHLARFIKHDPASATSFLGANSFEGLAQCLFKVQTVGRLNYGDFKWKMEGVEFKHWWGGNYDVDRLESDVERTQRALRNLLQPEIPESIASRYDWDFTQLGGSKADWWQYGTLKGKSQCVLSIWMGYCNIVECHAKQRRRMHGDGRDCTLCQQLRAAVERSKKASTRR